MGKPVSHWNDHARQWRWLASPLRPAPEDVAIMESALEKWRDPPGTAAACALLLGVTPEIATMRWPAGTRLLSADRSEAMIRSVWPGATLDFAMAVCCNWAALPLAGATQDIAVCDGGFTGLAYPDGYRAVVRELRRVLRGDGMFLSRFFVRPEARESPGVVMDDLSRGRIGNFHVFKWRLAMALHGPVSQGVRLADIWSAWCTAFPDPAVVAARLGWPLDSVNTIHAYRNVDSRYTFPTLDETRAILAEDFVETGCRFPNYELGERCPILTFRPR